MLEEEEMTRLMAAVVEAIRLPPLDVFYPARSSMGLPALFQMLDRASLF